MVCAKKTKSAAAAVATAASSMYQSYTTGASSTGAPAASALVTPVASNSSVSTNIAAASSSGATAANSGIKGFNYGAFFMDYTAKTQSDFEYEFQRAQDLDGTSGWSSARLYTMSKFYFLPPHLRAGFMFGFASRKIAWRDQSRVPCYGDGVCRN